MSKTLSEYKGIGAARLSLLEKAGITTPMELICFLPKGYRDLSSPRSISSLIPGEEAAVCGRIGKVSAAQFGGLTVVQTVLSQNNEAQFELGDNQISLIWYNQPWLKQSLSQGQALSVYGRVEYRAGKLQITSPVSFDPETDKGLQAIYAPIKGFAMKSFVKLMAMVLSDAKLEGWLKERLPSSLIEKYGLCSLEDAYFGAHFPENKKLLSEARRRLAFEELLLYQAALSLTRGRDADMGIVISQGDARIFWDSLPFKPTNAQRRVLDEIIVDLGKNTPMARLVQGDVGSGKTAVAFGALYLTAMSGYQGALMAPTEILAQQHYEYAKKTLEPLGITCGLLTGSLKSGQRKAALKSLESHEWQVVVGTHALISPGVKYARLGLAITDEQHRFGVRQRTRLAEAGEEKPNVLVMSATPIPRTLAIILFGDLDLSIIDEMPAGRARVKTHIVPERKREGLYGFIKEQVRAGRQAYVICPLVEESEAIDAANAERTARELQKKLTGCSVALLHGKMDARSKDAVMSAFYSGEVQVLVSTTVVEVGVNVPNATVMVVENAERFGLSQLHQLRGRVGRGAEQSYCFLMSEPNERLSILVQSGDGFVISQKDLELRGPGQFLGTRQHGLEAARLPILFDEDGRTQSAANELALAHEAMRELMRDAGLREDARQVLELAKTLYAREIEEAGIN